MCEKILDTLINTAKEDGINDVQRTLGDWRKNIEKLKEKLKNPPKTRIAVYGNTGEGKSSLLNALFDEPDLLPHHGMGDACTSVITKIETIENRQEETQSFKEEEEDDNEEEKDNDEEEEAEEEGEEEGEEKKEDAEVEEEGEGKEEEEEEREGFQAEIMFFTEKEWEKEYEVLKSDLAEDTENPPKHDVYKQAETKLAAVYGPFKTTEELENKMKTRDDIKEKLNKEKEMTKLFPSAIELQNEIKDYIVVKRKGTQLWPIVKCVVIRLYNPRICYGEVVFTDLPGIADSNPVRVAMANEEQQYANVLLKVARIDRCKANPSIQAIFGHDVVRQMELDQQERNIVCTRTDESIDVNGALECMDEQTRDKAENMRKLLEEYKRKIKEEERRRKSSELLSKKKFEVRKKLDSLCATVRNATIKNDFSEDLETRVFCVSSTDYMEILDQGEPKVFQKAEETEIPELRQFLKEKALGQCQRELQVLKGQFQSVISDSLSYLRNMDYGEKGHSRKEVSKELQRMEEVLTKTIPENLEKAIDDKYKERLLPSIETGITDAENSAVFRSTSWSSDVERKEPQTDGGHKVPVNLHWKTFKATVDRKGYYERKEGGHIDFNKDLTDPFTERITQPWLDVFGMKTWKDLITEHASDPAEHAITGHTRKVVSILQASQKRELEENLSRIETDAISKLQLFKGIFEAMVVPQQRKANRLITDSVKEQMGSTYEDCAIQSEKGAHGRAREIIKKNVETLKDSLFKSAGEMLENEILMLKKDVCKCISTTLENLCQDYWKQMDGLWMKQRGKTFSNKKVLNSSTTALQNLLEKYMEKVEGEENMDLTVKTESRKRRKSDSFDESAKRSRSVSRIKATIELKYKRPEDEEKALCFFQENLEEFLVQEKLSYVDLRNGSIVIEFLVPEDLHRQTIQDVVNFVSQGPPSSPSNIRFQLHLLPRNRCDLTINAQHVQVGSQNTMNVQGQDESADPNIAGSLSTLTTEQSGTSDQPADQLAEEESDNLYEVAVLYIHCTEGIQGEIRAALEDATTLMESSKVIFNTVETPGRIELKIRRGSRADLTMVTIVNRIVSYKLGTYLMSDSVESHATYNLHMSPETE